MVTALPSLATVLEALVEGSDVIADDVAVIAVVSVVSNVLEGAVVCVITNVLEGAFVCVIADAIVDPLHVVVVPRVLVEGVVVCVMADVVLAASPSAASRSAHCSRPGHRIPAGHHLAVHVRTTRTPAGVVLTHAPIHMEPGVQIARHMGRARLNPAMVRTDRHASCFRYRRQLQAPLVPKCLKTMIVLMTMSAMMTMTAMMMKMIGGGGDGGGADDDKNENQHKHADADVHAGHNGYDGHDGHDVILKNRI